MSIFMEEGSIDSLCYFKLSFGKGFWNYIFTFNTTEVLPSNWINKSTTPDLQETRPFEMAVVSHHVGRQHGKVW